MCDNCFSELCTRRVSNVSEQAVQRQTEKAEVSNGVRVAPSVRPEALNDDEAEESSDSEEDSEALENSAANISIEDEKPTFYAEVPAGESEPEATATSETVSNGN